jgi:sulfide:quinone oxidoreductase
MQTKILVLGAGFGGLEISTLLSETLGESIEVALIDRNTHFVFGFSKLGVMFGHAEAQAVRLPYTNFTKSNVQFIRQTITKIDPVAKQVTTDAGTHTADYLVVALGADYDWDATPGLTEVNEFYTTAGAQRLREILPNFTRGRALIGVCGAPYKCPPAPSECALMLHDYLERKGVRDSCEISFVLPLPTCAAVARDLQGVGRGLCST